MADNPQPVAEVPAVTPNVPQAIPEQVANLRIFTPPQPGALITSHATGSTYQIGSVIGEGNFGVVYAGTDTWKNDLPIKVFKPKGLPYDVVKGAAVSEYQKLVHFRHPFITYIFDAFEFQHTFYIVTERCYRPLSEFIASENFDGYTWMPAIARCVLQAVHFIHVHGFVHQDIHLGNVFAGWTKDELLPDKEGAFTFKIGDLGLTKLLPDIDAQNTVLADWMKAPEALDAKQFGPMDQRMDIYHVGLLFLQVLHGQNLKFSEEDVLAGRPREMAAQLVHPYGPALAKALRRHADARTSSAMDFWQDLFGSTALLAGPTG